MNRCLAAMVVVCAGCAAAGPEVAPPSVETLCELAVGTATQEDARGVLGPETMATGTPTQQTLVFRYGSETDAVFVMLTFDEHGVLIRPVTMGVPFPACWKNAP